MHSRALAARGGTFWRCGIFPAKVVDPSGSGDAFDAGARAVLAATGSDLVLA